MFYIMHAATGYDRVKNTASKVESSECVLVSHLTTFTNSKSRISGSNVASIDLIENAN